MENTIKLLTSIAEELDSQGLAALASRVDAVAVNALNIKTAQYVGIQGYAIRNSRCWGNCYRKKRVENPKKAAQAVWTECHKEYVESINNDGSKWDKYADSNESFVKVASVPAAKYKEIDKKIAKIISNKVASGLDLGNAIFASIDEVSSLTQEQAVSSSNELLDIATELVSNPHIANKLSEASTVLLKDAQLWNTVKGLWDPAQRATNQQNSQSNNLSNQINSLILNTDKAINDIVASLQKVNTSKQNLASYLQGFKPSTPQQQQQIQIAQQGLQGFKVVEPSVVQSRWQKIRQSITLGTGATQTPSTGAKPAAGAVAPGEPGAAPGAPGGAAGAAGAAPGGAAGEPGAAGGAPGAAPARPTKAPKGNNVPMPPDVKDYLSKLPMKQLQKIINDAKHLRTDAYNVSRIKESQVPGQPRVVQDQIHHLRDLPPNVRQFLEGLNANQLQAVLNDLEAEKYAWSSVDKRRNFVR